jgi:hypothetical protein
MRLWGCEAEAAAVNTIRDINITAGRGPGFRPVLYSSFQKEHRKMPVDILA